MEVDLYIYITTYVYVCTFRDEGSLIKERTAKGNNAIGAFLLIFV